MAKITCAISGIRFSCDHLPLVLGSNIGYYHPVFALPHKKLYGLYSKHCSGHLTATDSYLLFLAFLHNTGQVEWTVPAACNPTDSRTIALIENNLRQLIEVTELTGAILHPSFEQPSFKVSVDNSSLETVPNWIHAWDTNLELFKRGSAAQKYQEDLQKVENKLSYYIKSGMRQEEYVAQVASWASKAAAFPKEKHEQFTKIIRSCFNSGKMFSIPLPEIKEVKAFCEENIEAGSIHFHTLMEVLREGVSRHTDFLGMNPVALGYTLLDADTSVNDEKIAQIIAAAPTDTPVRGDYGSNLEYIRAKLRYKTAAIHAANTATDESDSGEEL